MTFFPCIGYVADHSQAGLSCFVVIPLLAVPFSVSSCDAFQGVIIESAIEIPQERL